MKNMLKKGMGMLMVFSLLLGVLAVPGQNVQAAASHYGVGFMLYTDNKNQDYYQEISTQMSSYSCNEISLKQTLYPKVDWGYLDLNKVPKGVQVKSVSTKTSNSKVFKVVDKKKGKVKAVKIGTAKLTFKVVWRHTGKSGKVTYPKYKKCTTNKDKKYYGAYKVVNKTMKVKKGKTYSVKVTLPYRVVCKKHKYGTWKVTKKATCSQYGEKQVKCKKCGHIEIEGIDMPAHKYGEWKVTKEATCRQYGEKERICAVCKEKEEDEIDKLPHQYNESGVCTVCGMDKNDD